MISLLRMTCVVALVSVSIGCGADPGEVRRLRHGGLEYQMTYDHGPDGPVMREGPDSARIAALFAGSTSGYAADPLEPDLYWVYRDDGERDLILGQLRDRARGATLPAEVLHDGVPSCGTEYLDVFRDGGYGGSFARRFGEHFEGDLRNIGFDNHISSLKFDGSQVVLYQHPGGGGRSLSFLYQFEEHLFDGDPSGHCVRLFGEVPSLRQFPLFPEQGPGPITTWDNQASSLRLRADL
jgi:hypothetical protein